MKRMIDANALSIVKFTALVNEYAKGWNDAIDAIMENQPTVDAEPVRHGKWTVTPTHIKCSECGESFILFPQNYCPNCGCRMDEDGRHV